MDNDAKMVRCFVLTHNVSMLAHSGRRNPEGVSNILQVIQDDPNWEQRLVLPTVLDTSKIREELILWQQFDKNFFPDVNVGNYTNLRMPNPILGFNWPIVNARGISTSELIERMRKEFKV